MILGYKNYVLNEDLPCSNRDIFPGGFNIYSDNIDYFCVTYFKGITANLDF